MKGREKRGVPGKNSRRTPLKEKIRDLEKKMNLAHEDAKLCEAKIRSDKARGILTRETELTMRRGVLYKQLERALLGIEIHRLRGETHAINAVEKLVENLEKEIDDISERLELAEHLEGIDFGKGLRER